MRRERSGLSVACKSKAHAAGMPVMTCDKVPVVGSMMDSVGARDRVEWGSAEMQRCIVDSSTNDPLTWGRDSSLIGPGRDTVRRECFADDNSESDKVAFPIDNVQVGRRRNPMAHMGRAGAMGRDKRIHHKQGRWTVVKVDREMAKEEAPPDGRVAASLMPTLACTAHV
ncbi:hypothetical protein BCR44DRAFT_1426093 [Catenaria anguillulae PL171]|uniref:Uncharacterized protein n=1 Tax=Catenaria anguillulae PL171 TaxID=765915 RepID=A0A1Y2I1D7_9FUNG|nr:hypothetical protein BCR44DRAFT_1426093 [Catenaria anguillulae PL171]